MPLREGRFGRSDWLDFDHVLGLGNGDGKIESQRFVGDVSQPVHGLITDKARELMLAQRQI